MRSFWDRRPCNLRHSDAPVGSRRYFDEVEARKYTIEPHIPGFADFPAWQGKRVLEIGCGMGGETVNFARAGARVTAVDVSPTSLALARRRAEVYWLKISFVEGDAEHLADRPLRLLHGVNPFDLVWSFGVIHHSPRPDRVLAEARRVIAPDGLLRVMVYHRASTKVAALVARHPLRALRGVDRAVAAQSEAQSGCPVTFTYTRRQARQLVEAAMFEVTTMRVAHIFPWAIGPYRKHQLVRRWYWRPVPPSVFRWLERRVGWHLLIEARPV